MNTHRLRGLGGVLYAAGFFAVLAGCNSSSSTPSTGGGGAPPPPRNSRVYVTDATGAVSSNPNSPNRIDVFSIASLIGGTGTAISPIQEIMSGSFSSAYGIAVDSNANIYVVDHGSSAVLVFHNNASGTAVAPFRTITSSAMVNPVGIALDGSNNIYVTVPGGGTGTTSSGSILEFSSTQTGAVTPIRTITGASTHLSGPYGITLRNGAIYVTNNLGNTVEVFGSPATGNSPPLRTIAGAASGLNSPFGIAVDPSKNIYVANAGSSSAPGDSITVYGPSHGSTPIRTIVGANTGLVGPTGLALDGNNNLYVALFGPPGTTSSPTGELEVFAPGANGNASPRVSVTGIGFAAWGVAVY